MLAPALSLSKLAVLGSVSSAVKQEGCPGLDSTEPHIYLTLNFVRYFILKKTMSLDHLLGNMIHASRLFKSWYTQTIQTGEFYNGINGRECLWQGREPTWCPEGQWSVSVSVHSSCHTWVGKLENWTPAQIFNYILQHSGTFCFVVM